MPDYPIVDTHLHIWDTGRLRYPWLDDVPLLNRSYLIGDYRQACGDVAVEKMVFLQAEVDVSLFREEADWVSSVAAEDPRIEGIVAWAPLVITHGFVKREQKTPQREIQRAERLRKDYFTRKGK